MIQLFQNINGVTTAIDKPEHGTWVNILPPFKQEEFTDVSETLEIPIEFLQDSLDIDERPRFELSDNVRMVVIKTPTENNSFENGAIKKFLNTFQNRHPDKRNMMVLKIFEKVTQTFMEYLKEINHRRNVLEQRLYEASRNEELFELMRIQKSLVYFVTALRSNELVLIKMERTNFLGLNEEEREFLNDQIIDMSQALEMANIYTNILSSTLDAFASIIANNQNLVLKRLAGITIILQFPVLVASIYGMNVPIPYADKPHAFYVPILMALSISLLMAWYFVKKKWF